MKRSEGYRKGKPNKLLPMGTLMLAIAYSLTPLSALAQLPSFSPAPVVPGQSPTGEESVYALGGGDRLRLDIFDVPEYSGEYAVLVDGTLNLPVVGSVLVRGLTLQEATKIISDRYARFVRRPLITLSLLAPRPIVLAIAGEVNRAGTYSVPIAAAGGNQFPTVTQAITLAGGITQTAAVREVQVRRRRTANRPEQTINVNLWNLYQGGDLTQDITLRDGDSIFIPPVAEVNPQETSLLADASFASTVVKPINIAVVGEVARPGPYAVTGGGTGTGGATGAVTGSTTGIAGANGGTSGLPTLTKAIQVAGGITSLANIRDISVQRRTRSGESRTIKVNLWELLRGGDVSQDIILQEGDTITIPTATALDPGESTEVAAASFSPNTIVVNVVGEVSKAGAIPVPPNTPLNQAILAAGGFNVRARRRTVDLIRLNPDGTVTKRTISVDLAQGLNETNNPTLRNNDVVVVNRSFLAGVSDTLTTIVTPFSSFFTLFNFFRIFQ